MNLDLCVYFCGYLRSKPYLGQLADLLSRADGDGHLSYGQPTARNALRSAGVEHG